jgi:aminoglycoside 3-N-acetyltransferase
MQTVNAALDLLGVKNDDILLVHSGISNLGKVEGGAKSLLTLIREKVGGNGTLLFPAFPITSTMFELLSSGYTFNSLKTPSRMGTLTEVALNVEGRYRSIHPSHSVVAIGAKGAEFVADHHLSRHPFDEKSPFWKLTKHNGKILLVGVGLNSVTSFHVIEDVMGDRFPVKIYLDKLFDCMCLDDDGNQLLVRTLCHDPNVSKVRNCERVRKYLLDEKVMQIVKVGEGEISLIDAQGLLRCLDRLWQQNNMTIYGKLFGFF